MRVRVRVCGVGAGGRTRARERRAGARGSGVLACSPRCGIMQVAQKWVHCAVRSRSNTLKQGAGSCAGRGAACVCVCV